MSSMDWPPTKMQMSAVRQACPACSATRLTALYIIVVYEMLDADTIYPVTAYAVPEP
jgi:hypothetical protein